MSPDSLGPDVNPNLYTYCNNNPLNWVDPYGLFGGKPPIDFYGRLYDDYINRQIKKAWDELKERLKKAAREAATLHPKPGIPNPAEPHPYGFGSGGGGFMDFMGSGRHTHVP